LIETEGVDGNPVFTFSDMNIMRSQMEQTIQKYKMNVINTTRGGAKIAGSDFMEMDKAMHQFLEAGTVIDGWHLANESIYDMRKAIVRGERLEEEMREHRELLDELLSLFQRMNTCIQNNSRGGLNILFNKTEKTLDKLMKNVYHQHFCEPMLKLAARKILTT